MKAVILARVSTEEQKEAGNSLPAQRKRLEDYCKRKGFEVHKVFSFDESAYKDSRSEFEQVVKVLESFNEKVVFCCDKIDRLTRNVFDKNLATLEELRKSGKLELHFVSDNVILHKDSPATDLFRFTIGTSLAKYYSDSISDNVKRATEQKLRSGEWPGKAPIGYRNVDKNNGKKWVIVEPFGANVVEKMYEWYGTSSFSMLEVKNKVKEVFNLNFSKGRVDHILKNPFYCGTMLYKEKEYPHNYERVIPRKIFDKDL